MKLLSIDLDGTLLTTEHEVSKECLDAIKKAKEKGIEVVFNSGRDITEIVMYPELVELKTPLICMNGTKIYSSEHRLLNETCLKKEDFLLSMELLEKFEIYTEIYTNECVYAQRDDLRPEFALDLERVFLDYQTIAEKKDVVFYKVIAHGEPEELQKIAKKVKRNTNINVVFSYPYCMEITDKSAAKGLALRTYECLTNQRFDEIYAIGDGGNDLDQFRVASVSVAMENAPDEIKKEATFVTKSRDEEGVAYAIKHLFKLI
jgi:Cof subfamily protein (haloacid dehalogenase superfamily)